MVAAAWASVTAPGQGGRVLLEAAGLPAVPALPPFLQLPGSHSAFPRMKQGEQCGTRQQHSAMSLGLLLLTLEGPSEAFGVSAQEVQQAAC